MFKFEVMLEVTKTFEKYDLSRNCITWVAFQFVILMQFLIGFINIMIIKFIIIIKLLLLLVIILDLST